MALPRFSRLDPAKKAKVISVATEEFARKGYENASLSRIIAGSGMSRGALYYYFADKDDLYQTVLEEFVKNLFEVWSGSAADEPHPFDRVKTPEEYWEEWMTHHRRSLRYSLRNPVFWEMYRRSVRIRAVGSAHPALNAAAEQIREWIGIALKRGEQVGAVRDDLPEGLLLDSVFGMMEGLDRWLVQTWAGLSEEEIEDTASLVTGFLRRLVEPVPNLTKTSKRQRK